MEWTPGDRDGDGDGDGPFEWDPRDAEVTGYGSWHTADESHDDDDEDHGDVYEDANEGGENEDEDEDDDGDDPDYRDEPDEDDEDLHGNLLLSALIPHCSTRTAWLNRVAFSRS